MVGVYRKYAKYYDLLYNDKNYEKEACYVDSLISKYSKGTKSILEIGCGTGIHATELLKKNYCIDGIDFSKKMISMAEKRKLNLPEDVASRLSFSQGDAREFRNRKKYDAVVSLFHVINYMTTNDDIEAMLKTAKIHLKKNGLFIFDSWYGPAVLTDRPVVRVKKLEDEEMEVIRNAQPEMFPNENIVDVNYELLITDKKTGKSEKTNEKHRVRYLFKPEVEQFLKNNGFDLVRAEQWQTGSSLGFDTWLACFVARLSHE